MQELLHVKNGIVPPNKNIQKKYSDPAKLKLGATGTPFLMMKPSRSTICTSSIGRPST